MKKFDLRKIASGDKKATKELLEYIHPRLRSYLQYRLWPEEQYVIDDLVQDIFFAFFSSLSKDRISDDADPIKYCYLIAKNKISDYYKYRAIRKGTTSTEENQQDVLLSYSLKKEEDIDYENLLKQAILRLPEEQSKVVFARLEGKSYKEIAQELGVPVNRVYYLNHSAIKSLRRFYLGEPDSDSKGGS